MMRKELPEMSKQTAKAPNSGANRQQRREQIRNPRPQKSSKPTWLRILIVALIAVLIIGFFLAPLLR